MESKGDIFSRNVLRRGTNVAPRLDLGIAVFIQQTEYINYLYAASGVDAEELCSQRSEIISILLLQDWSQPLSPYTAILDT